MKSKNYSSQQFVLEIQKRLGVLHTVDNNFTIGKNKLIFKLNNNDVVITKNREKTTGERKTFCEYLDMLPYVIKHKPGDKYQEEDVEKLTYELEKYAMTDLLKLSERYCICNKYHYLKNGLIPLFQDIKEENAQEFILDYLVNEASDPKSLSNSISKENIHVMLFTALIGNKKNLIYALIKPFSLEIYIIDNIKDTDIISLAKYNDNEIKMFEFVYEEYNETNLANAISKILKGYDKIIVCSGKITEYINKEKNEENLD